MNPNVPAKPPDDGHAGELELPEAKGSDPGLYDFVTAGNPDGDVLAVEQPDFTDEDMALMDRILDELGREKRQKKAEG
jgi:hypothetical protein